LQIFRRRGEALQAVVEHPEGDVALLAEQATDAAATRSEAGTAGMVMVDGGRPGERDAADGAGVALLVEQLVVLRLGQMVPAQRDLEGPVWLAGVPATVVRRTLLAVLVLPLSEAQRRAGPAVGL